MHIQGVGRVRFGSTRETIMGFTKEQAKNILKSAPEMEKLGEALSRENLARMGSEIASQVVYKPVKTIKIKRPAPQIKSSIPDNLPCTI